MSKLSEEKETIRRDMLLQLKKQSQENRMHKSRRIKDLALSNIFFKRASCVMFYAATSYEVDTREMIQEALRLGKAVALPVVDSHKKEMVPVIIKSLDSLTKSPMGILEPTIEEKNIAPISNIELLFVPGVAFDKWGNRLGRGLGFYDRFLLQLPPKTVKVGLAFDFQILSYVPVVQGQDVMLDLIISN